MARSQTMKTTTTILLITFLIISPCVESKRKKTRRPITTYNDQATLPFNDLSQLNEFQSLTLRQANVTSVSVVPITQPGPCVCGGGVCSCCSRIFLNLFRQRACVNVTYDPDEFAFTAKISMNDRLVYTRTVSGKNPSPICVPIPRLPSIAACIRFYNIYFQGRNVHVCVNMEGKFRETVLFKVGMDCLRLGANGVALGLKPEDGGGIGVVELFPENPTVESGEEDDYDYSDVGEDSSEEDY